ncbi:MAG: MarR family winged helix-turn-helix transcriptional regulator [Bryobacteraceae bacterium]
MAPDRSLREIDDFLGSAHIFASAVTDIIEQKLLEKIAEGQVTASQMKLLKLVGTTDSYTLGDVASFLRFSNAAASKTVDRLVRRDLLRRTEDQRDRRVLHLHLTRAGRRLLAAYENARQRKLQSIFVQFPPEELQRASELLDRLSADLVDHTSNPEELCLKCGIYFRERCLVRQLVPRNCFYQRSRKASRQRPIRESNGKE